MPFDLTPAQTPRDLPTPAHDSERLVHVGPFEGRGESLADCWVDALTALAKALAAEKAGPPHLATLTVRAVDPEAVQALDPWLMELLYREALGGNFCDTVLVEDSAYSLAVEGAALVPPAPTSPLYGAMEAPALNYAYSARAQVPDHMDYLEAWRKDGAAFQAENRTAELEFGDGPGRRIDLYMPEAASGDAPPPLHVFVHGGYWQSLDKADHGHLFAAMLSAGIAVAHPNYDLLPCEGVILDDLAEQCRQAVETLWAERDRQGYDMDRLTVSGHSAGGHLAAMLAATDWSARDADMPQDLVKGGVLVSGLYELEPVRLTGVNHAVGMDADMARRNSPVLMAPAYEGLPLVVAAGAEESDEFQRQSRDFAEAWEKAGASTEFMALDGCNHFTALEALGDPASPLGARAMKLIAAV